MPRLLLGLASKYPTIMMHKHLQRKPKLERFKKQCHFYISLCDFSLMITKTKKLANSGLIIDNVARWKTKQCDGKYRLLLPTLCVL